MAVRYWVGGTNDWNATAGTKWSASSGGAGGASAPTAADDVYFNAASGSGVVTITTGAVARSVDFNGFTGTLAGSTGINIGDATAGAGNVALRLSSQMTNTYTGSFSLVSTSATPQLIYCSGNAFKGSTIFSGNGGSWKLGDAYLNNGNATGLTTNRGTFDTDGFPVTASFWSSTSSFVRSLFLRSSLITLTAGSWNFTNNTTLSLDAGTSRIVFNANNPTLAGVGMTFYEIAPFNNLVITGSNSFNRILINGGCTLRITAGTTQTLTGGIFSIARASSGTAEIRSTVEGSSYTIASSTRLRLSHWRIKDCVGSGDTPHEIRYSSDLGGNSNLVFEFMRHSVTKPAERLVTYKPTFV